MSEPDSGDIIPARSITSRSEFLDALRTAFADAAAAGSHELWLCDADFAAWPLGERSVIAHLDAWVASQRRMTLVASHFDEVARCHGRWVEWRRRWSHVVACHANTELERSRIPTILLVPGLCCVTLADAVNYRGSVSRDAADLLRRKEAIDAVLQRSEPSFPATTTGL